MYLIELILEYPITTTCILIFLTECIVIASTGQELITLIVRKLHRLFSRSESYHIIDIPAHLQPLIITEQLKEGTLIRTMQNPPLASSPAEIIISNKEASTYKDSTFKVLLIKKRTLVLIPSTDK